MNVILAANKTLDVMKADEFTMDDISLWDYEHHPAIHGDMAV